MTGVPRFADDEAELRVEHGAPTDRVITVSGLVGVGTSTVARILADAFDYDHIDAGTFFRRKAGELGYTIEEFDERMQEIQDEQGTDFDLAWDRKALEYAFTRSGFVLEGRLAGALLQDIAPARLWLTCDRETTVERIMDRENMDRQRAEHYVEERNQAVIDRYEEKYGVDPRDDRFYNIELDNSREVAEVRDAVLDAVRDHLPE